MSKQLAEQLSDALVKVTEQRDQAIAELSHTKDQLALSQAQVLALKSQLNLHETARKLRQNGFTQSAAQNPASIFASSAPKLETPESGPTTPTSDI